MDLSAELKELRKQLYTYRYKSLELERQLRTHCHVFHRTLEAERHGGGDSDDEGPMVLPSTGAFYGTPSCYSSVFTNGLIMEIIASHLPIQDLLRCRLVCKLWAREMVQHLTRRKALVVAYEDCSEAKELLKKKQQGKFVNISTLCVLEIPITSQIIVDVVKHFGVILSGLKLDDCNPDSSELLLLLKDLPSLEVLSFKQTGVRRRNQEAKDVPSTLDGLTAYANTLRMTCVKKLAWEEIHPVRHFEQIIHMFPYLEELELLCWSKPDANCLNGLRLDTLRNLTISCDNNFSKEHFLALASLNLKLQKLTLHDLKPGGKNKMNGLKIFLESLSETLVEMNLNGNGRISEVSTNSFVSQVSPFPVDFPVLKKVNIDCHLMTNLKMLDHMPQLHKLECKFQDWKGWWHLLNADGEPKAHENLRELSLGAIDSGCLNKLVSSFTSVTKLEVSEDRIDDVAFRTIASVMSQLSNLRITTSTNDKNKKLKLTDSGFTGISADDCKRLRRGSFGTITPEDIRKLRKYPFIGDLKALYSLELACSEINITDIAILYGISELRRITSITLPKCKLTNASLDKLSEMPSLLVLELHKLCGITTEGVSSLRSRKSDLVLNVYSDLNSRLFA